MNTQQFCLSAVSSQSRRYQRATPTQLCVFFVCIDVVYSCFYLLWGWFTRNCATMRSIPAISKTQLRVILRAG